MVAKLTGLEARELIVSIGNAHLYDNHLEAAKEQLQRKPLAFPKLTINGAQKTIDDFKAEDFVLENYEAHPRIKAPLVIL
jgi:thymidylate synthase